MSLVLRAEVRGVERIQGVNSRTGEVYDFHVVHVLDGFKSKELRVPDDYRGPFPDRGMAEIEVGVRAVSGAGGSAFLRYEYRGIAPSFEDEVKGLESMGEPPAARSAA